MIEVIIPIGIQNKVTNKYVTLYRQMRRKLGHAYPRAQLINNINNALSINGSFIEPIRIKEPLYSQWKERGYKVISHNHWFFGVRLKRDINGDTIAVACDALHESDYHNDTMQNPPYESYSRTNKIILNESKLRFLIKNIVNKILNT